MLDPRVALAVFCEDIRPELGDKHSFMGVLTGPLVMRGTPPALMTRLAVAVWLICDLGDLPTRCAVSVHLAGTGAELTRYDVKGAASAAMPDDATRKQILFSACQVPPFDLKGPDTVEVWTHPDDGEAVRAGRLSIRFESGMDGVGAGL
ncbi:hypothetical protein F1188_01865 [Roseospira marina]|uniref:Uncharacterized protein n=1 Tax=Roseospira marina TaxID=140057 RepID=A0A5M6IIL6_9PROT|nr:hypothetical protein [Roseospira marina]KAA5607535.1 hypothetical protein F1188_01865 [Roseospira marina]MBB4312280.1 hypothetical protein [Roseospira marina]MBB5085704.1 hypothetical protein [Roseospira marina]